MTLEERRSSFWTSWWRGQTRTTIHTPFRIFNEFNAYVLECSRLLLQVKAIHFLKIKKIDLITHIQGSLCLKVPLLMLDHQLFDCFADFLISRRQSGLAASTVQSPFCQPSVKVSLLTSQKGNCQPASSRAQQSDKPPLNSHQHQNHLLH